MADTIYSSLPLIQGARCIRVLDVHPLSVASPDAALTGTMRVVDLDSNAAFTALSYVWGPKALRPKTIQCMTTTLELTDNCHSALTHLRRKLGPVTIWVDAICINQRDDDEKAHQLPLMGAIYTGASSVYVWLGEGGQGTDRAMSYLANADNPRHFDAGVTGQMNKHHFRRQFAAFFSPVVHRWLELFNQKDALLQIPEPEDLTDLLVRPWTHRVWTYQEIMLATNPIVVCGETHLDWFTFAKGVLWVDHASLRVAGFAPLVTTFTTWKKIALSRDFLQSIKSIPEKPSTVPIASSGDVHNTQSTALTRPSTSGDQQRTAMIKAKKSSPTPPEGPLTQYQYFLYRTTRNVYWYRVWLFFVRPLVAIAFVAFFIALGVCIAHNKDQWNPRQRLIEGLSASEAAARVKDYCLAYCEGDDACLPSCENISYSNWVPFVPLLIVPCVCVLLAIIDKRSTKSFRLHKVPQPLRALATWSDYGVDLIDALCTRSATDPRDMAFGLHAILTELSGEDFLGQGRLLCATDVLYWKLTRHLLRLHLGLHILIPAAIKRMPGQPSWVPKWSHEFPQYWISPPLVYQAVKSATPQLLTLQDFPDSGHHRELAVKGKFICTVDWCQPFHALYEFRSRGPVADRAAHLYNLGLMLQMFQVHWRPVTRRKFGEDHTELYDLILTPENHPSVERSLMEFAPAYCEFLAQNCQRTAEQALQLLQSGACVYRTEMSSEYWITKQARAELGIPWLRERVPYRMILEVHIAICNSLAESERHVFSTRDMIALRTSPDSDERHEDVRAYFNGREHFHLNAHKDRQTMGICTNDTKQGDKVLLVAGCNMPLIVRQDPPSDNEVTLVSPAMIIGVMQGQAWKADMKEREFKEMSEYLIV